jgi:hypothetical protein
MGNFISLSQCCGCKTRPMGIFGKPKRKIGKHTVVPLVRMYSTSIPEENMVIYPTTPPYFIGMNY